MICDECRWHTVTEPTSFGLADFCELHKCWAFVKVDECEWLNFDLEANDTCGSCEFYLGGGDWGLACGKHYMCIPTITSKPCDDYRRKQAF